jgi:hypothetical protein
VTPMPMAETCPVNAFAASVEREVDNEHLQETGLPLIRLLVWQFLVEKRRLHISKEHGKEACQSQSRTFDMHSERLRTVVSTHCF